MKKTWRNIIIIFWILIFVEVGVGFLFLSPYYKMKRLFDGVEAGNWQVASENYEKLNHSLQQRVQGHLDDYAAHLVEQYLDDKISYEQIAASFDAINSIDAYDKLMNQYMSDVTYNEFKRDLKAIEEANQIYDSTTAFDISKQLRAVRLRIDNASKEKALMEILNETYTKYLDEDITADQAIAFSETIAGMSYTDASEYIATIKTNIACVEEYRLIYADAKAAFDADDYFKTMKLAKLPTVDSHDDKYAELFETISKEAYDEGKIYYMSQLDKLVDKGDNVAAVALMSKITECYGDEIDLSETKRRMANDWQLAYCDLILDEEAWSNALSGSDNGRYILKHNYDKIKPDAFVLYDIDFDGTPEIFLYNEENAGDEYISCLIYTFKDGATRYVGFANVKSFCRDSCLIGYPFAFDREGGDEDSLIEFDGYSLSQVSYVQNIGETYYVNGAETDDVDYLSERTTILKHADAYNVGNTKGARTEEGEAFILAY